MSLLVRDDPRKDEWSDPELWKAYVQHRKREFAQKMMEAFTPIAVALSREIQDGQAFVERHETEPRAMVAPYDDLVPALLPLTELFAQDQDELRAAIGQLRARPGASRPRPADTSMNRELIQMSVRFASLVDQAVAGRGARVLVREEGLDRRISADPIGTLGEYYQQLQESDWFSEYAAASEREQVVMMDIVKSQARNGHRIYEKPFPLPTERFSAYLWSALPPSFDAERENHVERLGLPTEAIMVPLGEYGEEFAQALLKTTYVFIDQAVRHLAGLSRAVDKEYGSTIGLTARRDALATVIEGILSIKDTTVLLMAELGTTDATPIERFERLVRSDLVNHMSRLIPIGYIAPLVLTGRYIPDLVEEEGEGYLSFSASIREHGNQRRRQRREKSENEGGSSYSYRMTSTALQFTQYQPGAISTYAPVEVEGKHVVETGLGCPVSHRPSETEKSGLTELSEAFLVVMKRFLNAAAR